MDFFNKIGDFANKTYQKTSQKTGELAKEAKIKMKMNENKSKIKDLYTEIGKNVYQKYMDDQNRNIEEDIKEFCVQIGLLADEVEKGEKELLALKNKRICEKCSTEIDLQAKFCPKCGAEQPEVPVQEAEIVNEEETTKNTEEATEDQESTETKNDNEN